jgi:hypothetical protein
MMIRKAADHQARWFFDMVGWAGCQDQDVGSDHEVEEPSGGSPTDEE